jgi:hypothetical protein
MTVIALSRLCKEEEEEVEGTYTFSPIAKCILGLATAGGCCIILSKNLCIACSFIQSYSSCSRFPFLAKETEN